MFDCADNTISKRQQRKSIVDTIRDIKIIHVCCCCGRKIETFWDSNNELDGRWMALETEASEIFLSWVAWPDKILCNWCFGTGEWKKKGIKWK